MDNPQKIGFNNFSLPPADLKIVRRNNVYKIFDILRKKYVCLTEEEFVRQTFVDWMITGLGYPASLMANEIGIQLNNTLKRCDTVVFSNDGKPKMIIEYKAPGVLINQKVFDQIVKYNIALNAKILIVSNGCNTYCCKINDDKVSYTFLSSVPTYQEMKELCSFA